MRNNLQRIVWFGFFCCIASAASVSTLYERGYSVIPEPQKVALGAKDFQFGAGWRLEIGPGVKANDTAIEALSQDLESRFHVRLASAGGEVVRLVMSPGLAAIGAAEDRHRDALEEQAYRIDLAPSLITVTANASAGLFYGVETLVQLLSPRDGALWLPEGRIEDWPDLELRHIYWDDAHHLDRPEELKRAIRRAAFFKINGFVLKLEGHFQFKSAPALVEPYALSQAEYQELTDYGLRYHVQLIPYLDGPAHIAFILKHPEYAKYRSFADSNYEMCVVNPEAVRFLSGMFQDLVDANRGGKFVYLSTDEAYYVGLADNPQCGEKAAAEKKGSVGKLLAQFVSEVAGPLHDQGRTVLFWGEYPLKPADIDALPPYLVNGEVYGPSFDPVFRQHGIRQMIFTSTQAGRARLFPEYFTLPDSRRLHPAGAATERVADGVAKISLDPARKQSDLIGAVVAGWADMGLHAETFWLGYATITAAAWHPAQCDVRESMAAFYGLYYGAGASHMDRVYQLMSQQAEFWLDSWESGPSPRKPLFGSSYRIYNPRQPVKDQTLALPSLPGTDLRFDGAWLANNGRRLALAAEFLAENDELQGLLEENLRRVQWNRYNLQVFLSVAKIYGQNLDMLLGMGQICTLLRSAQAASEGKKPDDALESLDQALEVARQILEERNTVLRDASSTWYRTWFPRVAEANGRRFLHELDDVKDHAPDRTVDMSYLVGREIALPFGDWVEGIREVRNQYAAANALDADTHRFNWKPIQK